MKIPVSLRMILYTYRQNASSSFSAAIPAPGYSIAILGLQMEAWTFLIRQKAAGHGGRCESLLYSSLRRLTHISTRTVLGFIIIVGAITEKERCIYYYYRRSKLAYLPHDSIIILEQFSSTGQTFFPLHDTRKLHQGTLSVESLPTPL